MISFLLPIRLRQNHTRKMDAKSAPTPACRKQICYPDIKKPLVMTLVTRSICCQISRKVLIETKNAPEHPMVSISKKRKKS
jgi:hypothetical protein